MTGYTLAADDSRHGTANGYSNLKCRCRPCRDANSESQSEYRQRLATTPRHLIPHGSVNGYSNYRCRCALCRAAHTDYRRVRRQGSA